MKKYLLTSNKNRNFYKNEEIKSLSAKIILRSKKMKYIEHIKNHHNSNNSFCKIKNICYLTYRTKSVLRLVKISRIKFKDLNTCGFVLGVKKYTW